MPLNYVEFIKGPFKGRDGEVMTEYYEHNMTHVLVYGSPEVEATVPDVDFVYADYREE